MPFSLHKAMLFPNTAMLFWNTTGVLKKNPHTIVRTLYSFLLFSVVALACALYQLIAANQVA